MRSESEPSPPMTEADIWLRALLAGGDLTPDLARAFLQMALSDHDTNRSVELSQRSLTGTLTCQEKRELDSYERVGRLLSALQLKVREALARKNEIMQRLLQSALRLPPAVVWQFQIIAVQEEQGTLVVLAANTLSVAQVRLLENTVGRRIRIAAPEEFPGTQVWLKRAIAAYHDVAIPDRLLSN